VTAPWHNPLVIRYWQTRVVARPPWVGAALVLASCLLTLLVYTVATSADGGALSAAAAGGMAWRGLLVLQCWILVFMAVGSAADGMVREQRDGVLDYQRLTPQRPVAKVFGYLFGLPLREYLLVALTLPFSFYFGWRSGLSVGGLLAFHACLWLFAGWCHLGAIALAALAGGWRAAPRLSQACVLLLFFGLPALDRVQVTVPRLLTLYPAIDRWLGSSDAPPLARTFLFFEWRISELLAAAGVQLLAALLIGRMLQRWWHNQTLTPLGKPSALVAMGGGLVLIFGNYWPAMTATLDSSARGVLMAWWPQHVALPLALVAAAWIGGLLLIRLATPAGDLWRGVAHTGLTATGGRASWWADQRHGPHLTAGMLLLVGACWLALGTTLWTSDNSRWLLDSRLPLWQPLAALACGWLAYDAARRWIGNPVAGWWLFGVWFAPALASLLVAAYSEGLGAWLLYLVACNPLGTLALCGLQAIADEPAIVAAGIAPRGPLLVGLLAQAVLATTLQLLVSRPAAKSSVSAK
jgi:hypothetical protein